MKEGSTRAILLAVVALLALNLIHRQELPALAQAAARPAGSGIATDANGFYVYVVHEAKVYLYTRDEREKTGLALKGVQPIAVQP